MRLPWTPDPSVLPSFRVHANRRGFSKPPGEYARLLTNPQSIPGCALSRPWSKNDTQIKVFS